MLVIHRKNKVVPTWRRGHLHGTRVGEAANPGPGPKHHVVQTTTKKCARQKDGSGRKLCTRVETWSARKCEQFTYTHDRKGKKLPHNVCDHTLHKTTVWYAGNVRYDSDEEELAPWNNAGHQGSLRVSFGGQPKQSTYHRVVAFCRQRAGRRQLTWAQFNREGAYHAHHQNKKHYDNRAANLVILTRKEHEALR